MKKMTITNCQLSEKINKKLFVLYVFFICIVLIYCIYIYWFIMKHPIGFISFSLVLERGNLQDVFGDLQLVVFLCFFFIKKLIMITDLIV